MPWSAWSRRWRWCAGSPEAACKATSLLRENARQSHFGIACSGTIHRPEDPIFSPRFQSLLSRVGVPVLGVALVALAYRSYGWAGVAAAVSALVMWALLHFNRVLQVLKRAANRPIGSVDSAVMLNAKLRPGVTLLHVVAMTRALGELRSEQDVQPEVYRWTDNTHSHVTCDFSGGKLRKWDLWRPDPTQAAP